MEKITRKLIAPCGMNCAICSGHLREENKCPGCNNMTTVTYCKNCTLRKCEKRKNKFCYSCKDFPCRRLKQLDKRYREKYDMSEIKNLEYIKKYGIDKFVKKERKRWQKGDKVICVHNKKEY